jgi:hypothetical protein
MQRNARHADRFDAPILHRWDQDFLRRRPGQQ